MAVIKKFFFWNTRTGSMMVAFYSLCVAVICISLFLVRYVGNNKIQEYTAYCVVSYMSFVFYTAYIVVSLTLVAGVYVDKRDLLFPWLLGVSLLVIYELATVMFLSVHHSHQEETAFSDWTIVFMTFFIVRTIGNVYSFMCVYTQYTELGAGRGTYEFFNKPERRSVVCHLPVITTQHQIPLPPYIEDPPPYATLNPLPAVVVSEIPTDPAPLYEEIS
ncbi:uncharacterized protein LOC106167969 [Lingula anatina]|uniref:Uncharacterized protein LOC106167969 n=1 Tax=Lingula anatina TaxID=7574 RepID=A0A1S3IVW3_LINAN|nr:uncharacterized protein LOC106167969 [Lingula anatina]|eukprot:XP_013402332.1 uncharacterized protein LOC106167969 [Lingula anatina]